MNTPKRHPLNVGYLVVGLVFLGIAGSWALRAGDVVDTGDTRWLVPAVLLLAGTVGLVAFAAKGLSRGRQDPDDDAGSSYEPYVEPWSPYPVDTTEPTTELTTPPGTESAENTDTRGENR